MNIRKLTLYHKGDVQKFVQFPYDLYQHHPLWVPPLLSAEKTILNPRKHPYYAHSEADFFVAESEGQVLGRMAMLENHNANAFTNKKAAFFGYFDVVQDIEVARLLFDTGREWAHKRQLNEIMGPRGVTGFDGSVLVEGFEHRPALTMPYNYPYYDAFIKDSGYAKDFDLLSGYRLADAKLSERFYQVAERIKKRRNFWIKTFQSKKELRAWLPRMLKAHHEAMDGLVTYYPPTEAEKTQTIKTVSMIIDPSLIKLIMQDATIAGFVLAYPDIRDGLRKAKGRLWPFGWYHILRDQKKTQWVNIPALGFLPQYRGTGGNVLLYLELQKSLEDNGFKHIDIVQIHEDNLQSLSDIGNTGVKWYKRHRRYQLQLTSK